MVKGKTKHVLFKCSKKW